MPDIFGELARDWRRAEHAVAEHLPHHAASQTPAERPVNLETPALKENPMGFITDVRNEIATEAHNLAAHAVQFETTILPAVAAKLTALENNPVVDALLNAVHVPVDNFEPVISMINKLEEIWNPPQQQPAAPALPQQPAVPVGQ